MENRDKGKAQPRMQMGTEAVLCALSHDMRAPLDNVIALAQLSLDRLQGEGQAKGETVEPYLREILVAAHALEGITGDLIDRQTQEERIERFTARKLTGALCVLMGRRAQEKGQMLEIDVSRLGAYEFEGDYAALERTLTNLLSNAVKYTPPGGAIRLSAQVTRHARGRIEAEFAVIDNGMGMKPEFLARLYEPFSRAPEALERQIPGHGLGMAIVQRMTQRMKGTISVQSEWGVGTTFRLNVPLCIARGEREAKSAASMLAGKRFLLAEDNDLSAQIAQTLLIRCGASVCRAADGEEAVGRFESVPSGTYDAILMDMHMPKEDGCGAARRIRRLAREDARRIPILALTASADAGERRAALCAGMNACLGKPLDVGRLCAELAQVKWV